MLWYVRNEYIHRDLEMGYVDKIVQKYTKTYQHRNVEAVELLDHTVLA